MLSLNQGSFVLKFYAFCNLDGRSRCGADSTRPIPAPAPKNNKEKVILGQHMQWELFLLIPKGFLVSPPLLQLTSATLNISFFSLWLIFKSNIYQKKKKRRKERPLPAWCICFLMLLDGITWFQKVKFGFFLLSLFSSPYPPTSFSSFLPSLFSLYFFLVHTFNLSVSNF